MCIALIYTQASAQNFHEACAYDIEYYCADVEPGDGRIAACLYAHTDTITEACFKATDNTARILENFFDFLQETKSACAADIQEHCASEEVGDGQILQCLKTTQGVSEQCSGQLANITIPDQEN